MREISHPFKGAKREVRVPLQHGVQSGLLQRFHPVGFLAVAGLQDSIQGQNERLQFGVHSGKTCLSSWSASAFGIGS